MNWSQFKDPVSSICLAGAVVACWYHTQEMASSSPFTVMTNIFITKFAEFGETFRKNSITLVATLQIFYGISRTSIMYKWDKWDKWIHCFTPCALLVNRAGVRHYTEFDCVQISLFPQ